MRAVAEIVVGALAGSVAYWLALPREPIQTTVANTSSKPALADNRVSVSAMRRAAEREVRVISTVTPSTAREAMSVADERALTVLRNELIRATAEDMHRRGQDVLQCVGETSFAGAEKLRFSVVVDSTPAIAKSGRWKLVEIVDGEPLPESFAECATHAFGNGVTVAAASDQPFPNYHGELAMLYVIPAPRGEAGGS